MPRTRQRLQLLIDSLSPHVVQRLAVPQHEDELCLFARFQAPTNAFPCLGARRAVSRRILNRVFASRALLVPRALARGLPARERCEPLFVSEIPLHRGERSRIVLPAHPERRIFIVVVPRTTAPVSRAGRRSHRPESRAERRRRHSSRVNVRRHHQLRLVRARAARVTRARAGDDDERAREHPSRGRRR